MNWDREAYEDYYQNPRDFGVLPTLQPQKKKKKVVAKVKEFSPMTTTAVAIENFEKTINAHTAKKVADTKGILEQITQIKNAQINVYEETKIKTFLSQRAKALQVLMDNYIVSKLSESLHLLDDSIFRLKRHLYVKNGTLIDDRTEAEKQGGNHVECSLFMHAKLGTKKVELGKLRTTRSSDDSWGRTTETTTLSATVPDVPESVMALARKAMGTYHKIMSDLYNDSTTADLVADESVPTLEVLWIPSVESIDVKVNKETVRLPQSYDPALLMNRKGRYYLIGLWDSKDEEPFENILREFTVGSIPFPKKEKK